MKNFWKATLIPGLCCILAGGVLAIILVLGFSDELLEHAEEFSITEENYFDFLEGDRFENVNRGGERYGKADTNASYHFAVPEEEMITGLNFAFAVGEVEIRTGDTMEVTVTDMFENAISAEVKDGVWYIEDSLLNSGSVHSSYSPEITITIPKDVLFQKIDMYLAAGLMNVDELAAKQVSMEVDAGSLKVFELRAEEFLELKNGVGEITVYDAKAVDLNVDNGIGAIAITGEISGYNTIKCGIGEVKLQLTDRSSIDFNYEVECGIGEVEIGGRSYQGSSENISFDRSNADYFKLDCGIGHIDINVN